jgi:hypothetical protein
VIWHPEAPWPPHNYLTSPRGGGEKVGRTATWLDGKVISIYRAYPQTRITDIIVSHPWMNIWRTSILNNSEDLGHIGPTWSTTIVMEKIAPLYT